MAAQKDLNGIILNWAERKPHGMAYRYLADGTADGRQQCLTFAEVAELAASVAAELVESRLEGERALLLYPSGIDFIGGFWGSLFAGVVAVPAVPPEPARLKTTLSHLERIAADADAKAVLTSAAIAEQVKSSGILTGNLARLPWIATDLLPTRSSGAKRPRGDAPAFLQYTSGSTADPKGVMVSHANLIHNQEQIVAAFGHQDCKSVVGWLPFFHDMGLIGHVVQTLYIGATSTLLSPQALIRRPEEWLRAIDRFDAQTSGGPNFGYAHVVRRVSDQVFADLDLSRWRVAYCGAEMVQAQTMRAFARKAEVAGFRGNALLPCYGLAEATLIATCAPLEGGVSVFEADTEALAQDRIQAEGKDRGRLMVTLGKPLLGQRLRIVDPQTHETKNTGTIGEIWLRGESVASGYYRNPEETERVFGALTANGEGPFLRTGDLGALDENGDLIVTGRLKDLIIVRGRNIYPDDVEAQFEQEIEAVRPGGAVLFSYQVAYQDSADDDCERIALVAECTSKAKDKLAAVAAQAQEIMIRETEVALDTLMLVKGGTISKTSSGKKQRQRTRQAFEQGRIDYIALIGGGPTGSADAELDQAGSLPVPTSVADMEAWLVEQLAILLRRPAHTISTDANFDSLGLDSVLAVELAYRLDSLLQRPLHATVLYNVPTVKRLAAWLVEGSTAGALAQDYEGVAYPELDESLHRLEQRKPDSYRFDFDKDIPWQRCDEPGLYIPERLYRVFGLDVEAIVANREAWELLQAASALLTCVAFEITEITITLFIDTRWSALRGTKSILTFREEEEKHIRLFRRYADRLRAMYPQIDAEMKWDPSWGIGFWTLFRNPELFPNERAFHYLIWLFFTAFEEHSIYIADELIAADGIQPAWEGAHRAHRREETQHVVTDHAYLRAMEITEEEKYRWSGVGVTWLAQHYETFFAFGGARRLVARKFPELEPHLHTKGFSRSLFLQELMQKKSFRRTRIACPYLMELGQKPEQSRPTDDELVAMIPEAWLGDAGRCNPDPLEAL